ncbi:MAG: alkaline shock response membrane anchor protein AmaP [bacterium]
MKLIRPVIVVIFIAGSLFLGVMLVWAFLAEKGIFAMPFDLVATAKHLTSNPWNWRLGLAFLVIGGGAILLKMRELRQEQCIAFDNPGGEVAISMDAVEDFIRRSSTEFHGIKSIVPRIHAGAEGIGIDIRLDVWAGTNIPRLSEELQNSIKTKVQDSLGINVSYVGVNIGKIAGSTDEADDTTEERI